MAPAAADTELWHRLDARPPTLVAVLKPDHARDTDAFVQRYGARSRSLSARKSLLYSSL